MNKRRNALLATLGAFLIVPFAALAWTGPSATPLAGNMPAPVNVGTIDQVKNSALGVNGLAVFGNAILNGVGRYFNFGSTAGTSGYGIRDTAGVLEFKNSGGSWSSIQATVFSLVGGASSWTVSGNNIYNANTGNVGIGTASPGYKLHVVGDIYANGGWLRTSGVAGWYSETYGGGWYMQDSTWIRSYNSKPVYMSAGFDTGTPSGVGCGGGLGGGFTFRVCGTMQAQRYYDDDSNYYIDSNVDSQMNTVYANAFYYRSDERLKKNVAPMEGALDIVRKLQPVTFNWKDATLTSATQIGFIAQQVEQVEPTLVTTNSSTMMKSVDYARVTPLLVGAVQEQEKKIEAQQNTIDDQQKEIDTLKAQVSALLQAK